jgi:branched-chain amino acid transport system substrate-binding protein
MTRRSSRWLLALLAAVSLVASACASGEDDAATGGGGDAAGSDEPIVVGGTLGLTGTYSGPSAGYKVAYDYWLEQVNENGGLLGRPVEMKIYDDESNPTTAQQLYQTLINEDQVDLLLALTRLPWAAPSSRSPNARARSSSTPAS